MNYKESGVNVELADRLVNRIGNSEEIGKFAANFSLPAYHISNMVSSCDGVGTKILLALEAKRKYNRPVDSIGQDCVAMVVNDILCENVMFDVCSTILQHKLDEEFSKSKWFGCLIIGHTLIGGRHLRCMHVCWRRLWIFCWCQNCNNYPCFAVASDGDTVRVFTVMASLIRKLIEESNVSEQFLNQLLEPTRLYSSHLDLSDRSILFVLLLITVC